MGLWCPLFIDTGEVREGLSCRDRRYTSGSGLETKLVPRPAGSRNRCGLGIR